MRTFSDTIITKNNNKNYTYSVEHNMGLFVIAPYTCATCFGPYYGLDQACQFKNHLKEDTTK